MAIAAGPVLAFGTVVLGFSFSIVFTVHHDKGSLIRFFLGVTLQDTSSHFAMLLEIDSATCHSTCPVVRF